VLPEIGRTTRVCAYDRAGLGASDAVPGVRDASDDVRDLERVLARGRIAPPYVLVGHSYGGFIARLFARAHSEQVAGVVFVDASGYDATRRQLAIWPRCQEPALWRGWAKPVQFGVDLKGSDALESELRRLGDTPVVAITGAGRGRGREGSTATSRSSATAPLARVARRARRPVDRPHPRPCAAQ
jgi:pimeloyl-ACP methyl ester carboxylesterase